MVLPMTANAPNSELFVSYLDLLLRKKHIIKVNKVQV